MKNDDWPKNFVLPKTVRFVWNNSYVGACVSVITAWWPNAKFYFLVNCKIWLWINQKIFNLRLTEGIIDRNFPTFYVPIYPYKMYIFYCYVTLSGTCWKKFPIVSKVLRFLGFPVTKVHNVSCGPVKNVIFPFGQCNICSLDYPNFRTYLCLQNVPLFRTFLDLQNVAL